MLFLNYQLSSLQFYSFCLLLVSLRFSLFPIHLSKFQLNIFYHVFVFCLSCFLGPFPIPCRQALEEEIMNHSKDLFQAVNLGQMLKTVSSVDDKEFVQSKLDTAQASYIELQERCRRKAEMLQQALANAQLFGEDEVALMNWLNEIHTRLSEVSVEDYRLEVLEKQLADQRVYTPPQATHFVALSFKLHQSCFSLFCSFVCHHRNISCYSQWLSEVCFFFFSGTAKWYWLKEEECWPSHLQWGRATEANNRYVFIYQCSKQFCLCTTHHKVYCPFYWAVTFCMNYVVFTSMNFCREIDF